MVHWAGPVPPAVHEPVSHSASEIPPTSLSRRTGQLAIQVADEGVAHDRAREDVGLHLHGAALDGAGLDEATAFVVGAERGRERGHVGI